MPEIFFNWYNLLNFDYPQSETSLIKNNIELFWPPAIVATRLSHCILLHHINKKPGNIILIHKFKPSQFN